MDAHVLRPENSGSATVEAKLRAIAKAARHEFPTADIEVMLQEIEEGRWLSSLPKD